MKKILVIFALFLFLAPLTSAQANKTDTFFEAKIVEIQQSKSPTVEVEITEGEHSGKKYTIPYVDVEQLKRQSLQEGRQVIVSFTTQNNREVVYIVDHVRRNQLLLLFFVFMIFVFYVGRWKGLFSLLGMIFSFVIIGRMIVPGIIAGTDPIVISLLGSLFIIPVSFYIAHGLNKKTTISVISTFLSLILTALLAYIFVQFTNLTGYAAEESVFLQTITGGALNIKNLLLAGIIIGAMGVLDDITISQAAIIEKLAGTNPKFTKMELFTHGMDIGRDHIASLVNTLVLVYAGASLPLFLLFYNSQISYSQVINQELVATEIVRTLVSSIGIIAAVPITTALSAFVVKRN